MQVQQLINVLEDVGVDREVMVEVKFHNKETNTDYTRVVPVKSAAFSQGYSAVVLELSEPLQEK